MSGLPLLGHTGLDATFAWLPDGPRSAGQCCATCWRATSHSAMHAMLHRAVVSIMGETWPTARRAATALLPQMRVVTTSSSAGRRYSPRRKAERAAAAAAAEEDADMG